MDHLDHLVLQDSQALPARQALLELRVLLERPEQPELPVHLDLADHLAHLAHLAHLEQLVPRVLQVLLAPLVQQGILDPLVRLGLQERPELPELQVLLDLVFITSKIPRQRHHIMMVIDGMTPQRDWNLFG